MRIPVKRISLIIAFGATIAVGQEVSPQSKTESSVPQSSPTQAGKSGETKPPADTAAALDYLYNRKPQDGSAAKQAIETNKRAETKAIAADAVGGSLQEDSQLRARFERYLGMVEVPYKDTEAYQAEVKKISNLLRDRQTFEAWKQLYELAQFQAIDAGISAELGNRIETVWSTGKTASKIDRNNDKLQRDIKTATWNADKMSQSIKDQERDEARRDPTRRRSAPSSAPNGGVPQLNPQGSPQSNPPVADAAPTSVPASTMNGLEGKLQLTEEYLKALEIKARIKVNELKQEKLLDEAKKNFSEYISTLYKSGRFTHVILAADFYRRIFEEGEYPVEMANQVNAALEINRDVNGAIDVFRYKVERGELSAATDRLQEAFTISELHPAVLGLQRPLKEKISSFRQNLSQMKNLIEARDFGNLEVLLTEIKKSAVDFDTTKPTAIVNAVKLESQMRLGKAKLAAQQGDQKIALEEFQAAAEAWPGNPDLQDKATTFFNTQDTKTQLVTAFDHLIQEQNYRAIFEKQLAFAPAVQGDAKREEQLKDSLIKIKNAEVAVEKANTLMLNGDAFGAWESIELASKNLSDDKKLNKMRADLSGRSAEFVVSINKARDAEGRNEAGYSLTWYVNAQRQYPGSQIANEGIERISKKLLNNM